MGGISEGLRLAAALSAGFLITVLATEPVRRLAIRADFFDRPLGYKQHLRPTPYLGGASVLVGFMIGAFLFGGVTSHFAVISICAVALFFVGTLDDRVGLGIAPRLGAQIVAAVALWLAHVHWDLGDGGASLAVTVLWVVGVTNAFNLMDNLDGAAGAVGATCGVGAGLLALSEGDPVLGAFAFALAGACMGFLPYNLARPSRIFLGDGGSMPIGFLIAAILMVCPHDLPGWGGLLAAVPLVGLLIFDTTLVMVSRYRRGARILSGGRDHLTHRLFERIHSERTVAVILVVSQGLLCTLGIALSGLTEEGVAAVAVLYAMGGLVGVALIEGERMTITLEGRPS